MNSHGLEIGKRMYCNDRFRLFYNPLALPEHKNKYWFFWWMGKEHYICKVKKHKCYHCGYRFANKYKIIKKPNGRRKKIYCCNICYELRER